MISTNNLEQLTSQRPHDVSIEQKIAAYKRVGQAINMAVDRLMTIGETISEGYPEVKGDMFDSCKDARNTGKSIEQLCLNSSNDTIHEGLGKALVDRTAVALASRSLLSSITRVLLLVDIIVVKQLLTFKTKDSKSLENLECVMNFAKFVEAFSAFGTEIVELAYLTSYTLNCLREERRRTEMLSARQVLEHSLKMLITSSKVCLVHYNCLIAKENRNTVFCQIRRAMDHIHFIVKETILESEWQSTNEHHFYYHNDDRGTIHSAIQHFSYLMEFCRYKTAHSDPFLHNKNHPNLFSKDVLEKRWTSDDKGNKLYGIAGISESESYCVEEFSNSFKHKVGSQSFVYSDLIERLLIAFDKILENIHDFTDSAYTSHEMRENILIYCDHCTRELNKYLKNVMRPNEQPYPKVRFQDESIDKVLVALKSLSEHLVTSAVDQSRDLFLALKMSTELVNNLNITISKQNLNHFTLQVNEFHEHCDHILEVCKLLRHITVHDVLKEQVSYVSINLRIFGPQVILASKILSKFPLSSVAGENFEAFVDMWTWLASEVSTISKRILETTTELNGLELKYLTLSNNHNPNQNLAKTNLKGKEFQEASKGVDLEAESVKRDLQPRWNEDLCDNDIIKRAKNLSAMAFLMYQFTKGNGSLKTTQDLFTQAEYFAEEANRLYKILRQFSYQVPASPNKKDLLNILDRVPTFVQTLQFSVKDHTVGRSATFVKVDHVIRETKNLMCVINSVVTKCLECANKFNLDFNSISGGITSGSLHGDECSAGAIGDSKGTTSSTEGSM